MVEVLTQLPTLLPFCSVLEFSFFSSPVCFQFMGLVGKRGCPLVSPNPSPPFTPHLRSQERPGPGTPPPLQSADLAWGRGPEIFPGKAMEGGRNPYNQTKPAAF